MWPRLVTRLGSVVIGIVIGSGMAGLLVAWTNEGVYMTTPTQKIRAGKKKSKIKIKCIVDIVSLNVAIMQTC